jgi:aryl-alcohol dehydrogenase-like predicted oxidoreductase
MEYKNLGRTGLKVSRLCLGTMQFGWSADEATSFSVLSAAYEAGLNFIDTADIYSRWVAGNPGGVSEKIIGRWMKQAGIPREKVVIATKVRGRMGDGPNDEGLSRVHIMFAVEQSLRRLQTDYIDLYQTHWPDDDTPIDETLRALDDLVISGKVLYIGCSNYSAWQLVQSLRESGHLGLAKFDCIQPHYNLIERDEFERELQAVCSAEGIGVIPYSPLAGGFLTGKYRKGLPNPDSVRAKGLQHVFTDKNFDLIELMDEIGKVHEASVSQIALAWLLADLIITSPIIGPNTIAQWEDNYGALKVHLTTEEKESLDHATRWHWQKSDDE